MANNPSIHIEGIDEVIKILEHITPRHANNLMRNTVRGIASDIRKDIRSSGVKATGAMTKAQNVKVKMRRAIKGAHIAEVVFSNKAFYWRFVEHGTGGPHPSPSQPFVYPARNRAISRLDRMLYDNFSKKLEAMMARELKKQAKARK